MAVKLFVGCPAFVMSLDRLPETFAAAGQSSGGGSR